MKEWDISIYRGVLTGFNKAFIIDNKTKEALVAKDPKSIKVLKPVVRGRDIERYNINWKNLWLIDIHNGYKGSPAIDINNYPAVKKHLDNFYPKLEKRQDKGVTPYNLRNCAYHAEFEKGKIVWSEISTEPTFTLLSGNFYISNTAYLINSDDKYLLGVLNSDVCKYYMSSIATGLGKTGHRYIKQFVENFPIPQAPKSKKGDVAKIVEKILREKTSDPSIDTSDLEFEMNHLIFKLYELTEEESKVMTIILTKISMSSTSYPE